MTTDVESGLSVVMNHLLDAAGRDVELAAALRTVASAVLERLNGAGSTAPETDTDTKDIAKEAVCTTGLSESYTLPTMKPTPEPLPLLQMQVGFLDERRQALRPVYVCGRDVEATVEITEISTIPAATVERLEEIAEQLAMKAEACQWAIDNVDTPKREAPANFYERSADKEWHPWMLTRFWPKHPNDSAWTQLKQTFELTAHACTNLARLFDSDALRDRFAGRALSQARSLLESLAAAVTDVGQGYDCSQVALRAWLDNAHVSQPWVSQALTQLEIPLPANVLGAVDTLREEIYSACRCSKEQKRLFGKARFHAKKIAEAKPASVEVLADWRILASTLDGLVRDCGVRPSSVDVRYLLLPIHERLPILDAVPPGFDLCLRALDDYLCLNPGCSRGDDPAPDAPCVEEARRLLRDTKVVLIGGDMRPDAKRRIEEALGLKELIWVRSKVHASVEGFRPAILRSDVSLALLAIRWSSHSFVEVRDFCEVSGKPLVWLAGGYNPNQVAHQIMQQASARLTSLRDMEKGLAEAV
jgi:hypothetical protein